MLLHLTQGSIQGLNILKSTFLPYTERKKRKMKMPVCGAIFIICMLVKCLTDASVIREGVPYDESPALPYWSYSTNDFWRYIEYFRSIGAYHHINNMARTFFAHQPLGDTLGYEVPVADEEH